VWYCELRVDVGAGATKTIALDCCWCGERGPCLCLYSCTINFPTRLLLVWGAGTVLVLVLVHRHNL
jgi:hypothetical protein